MKSLELIYTIVIWIFTAILLGFLIYRVYKVFVKKAVRKSLGHLNNKWYPKVLKILFGLSMLLTIIYSPFYAYVGSGFKAIIPDYLNNLLVAATILLAGLESFLSFSISEKLIKKTYKKAEIIKARPCPRPQSPRRHRLSSRTLFRLQSPAASRGSGGDGSARNGRATEFK